MILKTSREIATLSAYEFSQNKKWVSVNDIINHFKNTEKESGMCQTSDMMSDTYYFDVKELLKILSKQQRC